MFIMMGILVAGILAGYLLRAQKKMLGGIGKLNMLIIYLLLFAMGLSVGRDENVMNNLGRLGIQGILISICSIAGSVLLSWLVYRYCFVSRNAEKQQ